MLLRLDLYRCRVYDGEAGLAGSGVSGAVCHIQRYGVGSIG